MLRNSLYCHHNGDSSLIVAERLGSGADCYRSFNKVSVNVVR